MQQEPANLDDMPGAHQPPFRHLGAPRPVRRHVLEQAGLLHPSPEAVSSPLFDGRQPFFLVLDKVQVKYEMLRAHLIDGLSATAAAEQHGYSRAAFYLITARSTRRGCEGCSTNLADDADHSSSRQKFWSSSPAQTEGALAHNWRRKCKVASA